MSLPKANIAQHIKYCTICIVWILQVIMFFEKNNKPTIDTMCIVRIIERYLSIFSIHLLPKLNFKFGANMSTTASVKLENLQNPIEFSISSDGYPSAVLKLLAQFFSNFGAEGTFEQLSELYMSEYSHLPNSGGATIEDEAYEDSSYTYQISDNGLTVERTEYWNKQPSHHPLDEIQTALDEYKVETARSIIDSLDQLSKLGIELVVETQGQKSKPSAEMSL
jgi:hypothetical protein